MSEKNKRETYTVDYVVDALRSGRERSASIALRWLFENRSDIPQRLILTCGHLLNANDPTDGDMIARMRGLRADLDDFRDEERRLFNACIYTTETRADLISDPNELAATLRQNPKPLTQARRSLRWLAAQAEETERGAIRICLTLLDNPSATHPLIVDAVKESHQLWPSLDKPYRALIVSCVYASHQRATLAAKRQADRARQLEADTGDVHRCGNCDGNLAELPEMAYCSDACRREAEVSDHSRSAARRPAATPTHEPAEKRAQRTYVEAGPIETQYDENYREIVRAIPLASRARKDERVVDQYENDRPTLSDDPEDTDEQWWTSELEFEARAMRPVADGALCTSCNLERSVIEHLTAPVGRCGICAEVDAPPLTPRHELIAA
ncbi:hypothetical protein AB0878_44955 [Amycolatopsis sp. NPDC047767]|uniref:hypothetical protein n=1 Tax=Amycolatopsis sp. NPDC047767 TaxID=3156765 RepID=UPI0034512240